MTTLQSIKETINRKLNKTVTHSKSIEISPAINCHIFGENNEIRFFDLSFGNYELIDVSTNKHLKGTF